MSATQAHLSFLLSGRRHAIPMAAVQEVLYLPFLQPTEGAAGALLGYFNARGESVPVLDLGMLLDLPEQPLRAESILIVVRTAKGAACGLLADAMDEIVHFEPADLREPRLDPGAEQRPAFVSALAMAGSGLHHLLDLDTLMACVQDEPRPGRYDKLFNRLDPELEIQLRARADSCLALPTTVERQRHPCLEILIGGEGLLLELRGIRSIAPCPAIFLLPGAPAALLGLVCFRNEVIPMLDLRPLLGIAAGPVQREAWMLVLEAPRGDVALYVEATGEVLEVDPDRLRAHPAQPASGLIRGEWVQAGRLLNLLDLDAVLSHPDTSIADVRNA